VAPVRKREERSVLKGEGKSVGTMGIKGRFFGTALKVRGRVLAPL
jgi:hypothetical protein